MALALAVGLSMLLCAELGVRAASRWLVPPLDWYSCFAQVKADEMRRHERDAGWVTTVFVGDSAVMSAFDPTAWQTACGCDEPAYNAGIPGATPRVVELWLRDAVLPSLHPKTVIIGLTSRGFNLRGTDGAYNAYQVNTATRSDAGTRLTRWAAQYSALIRYRGVLRDPVHLKPTLVKLAGGVPDEPWSRPSHRGFFPEEKPRQYGIGSYRNAANTIFRDYGISDVETAALARVVSSLQSQGIRVVLADMPVSEDYPGLHPGGAPTYERYREAVQAFATEHRVSLVDLRDLHEHRYFVDPIHMNGDGAARFSRGLVDRVMPCSRAEMNIGSVR